MKKIQDLIFILHPIMHLWNTNVFTTFMWWLNNKQEGRGSASFQQDATELTQERQGNQQITVWPEPPSHFFFSFKNYMNRCWWWWVKGWWVPSFMSAWHEPRQSWEGGISVEELSPTDVYGAFPPLLIDVGGPSPPGQHYPATPRQLSLGRIRKVAEQARGSAPGAIIPLWFLCEPLGIPAVTSLDDGL